MARSHSPPSGVQGRRVMAHLPVVASQLSLGHSESAEQVQKLPVPSVLGILQRWTYDLLSARLAATPGPRYFPREQAALARCAQATDAHRLQAFSTRLVGHRRSENHPLAARLVMEAVFLEYRQLFQ